MEIRVEMKAAMKAMPDVALQKMVLTLEQYQSALTGEDELSINGHMFDMARANVNEGSVTVFGLEDHDEDNLLVFLKEAERRSSSDKKQIPTAFTYFTSLHFVLPINLISIPLSGTGINSLTRYSFSDSVFFPGLNSPPPKS